MADAARRYEAHRPGLGTEFLEALDDAVVRIAEMPAMGSPVRDVADDAIRRRAVRRFPYHVIDLEPATYRAPPTEASANYKRRADSCNVM